MDGAAAALTMMLHSVNITAERVPACVDASGACSHTCLCVRVLQARTQRVSVLESERRVAPRARMSVGYAHAVMRS